MDFATQSDNAIFSFVDFRGHETQRVAAVSEHPINRLSAFAPIFMSILALLAVAHSYRHASHEDGNWHVWILLLFAQLPFFLYFVMTSRRQLRRVAPIVAVQATLWTIGLIAGAYQANWS